MRTFARRLREAVQDAVVAGLHSSADACLAMMPCMAQVRFKPSKMESLPTVYSFDHLVGRGQKGS
jgi:hypothetical protein